MIKMIYPPLSRSKKRIQTTTLANVDEMDGIYFEHYVSDLLVHQGYKTEVTKASGDMGVDILAEKGGVKYSIQVKRYNTNVSRSAISDAVAGKSFYGCDEAMVITNSYFSKSALEYARSTRCYLVDRDVLSEWITDCKTLQDDSAISSKRTKQTQFLFTPNQWLILVVLGVVLSVIAVSFFSLVFF